MVQKQLIFFNPGAGYNQDIQPKGDSPGEHPQNTGINEIWTQTGGYNQYTKKNFLTKKINLLDDNYFFHTYQM